MVNSTWLRAARRTGHGDQFCWRTRHSASPGPQHRPSGSNATTLCFNTPFSRVVNHLEGNHSCGRGWMSAGRSLAVLPCWDKELRLVLGGLNGLHLLQGGLRGDVNCSVTYRGGIQLCAVPPGNPDAVRGSRWPLGMPQLQES